MRKAFAGALLAVTLMTACTQSPDSSTPEPSASPNAVAFAACMRENGVPNYPDPVPGTERSDLSNVDTNSAAFSDAQEKCHDLQPGGGEQAPPDTSELEQLRDYAQCIRENGVPDFPDPDSDGKFPGIADARGNPAFTKASEACHDKLPA